MQFYDMAYKCQEVGTWRSVGSFFFDVHDAIYFRLVESTTTENE